MSTSLFINETDATQKPDPRELKAVESTLRPGMPMLTKRNLLWADFPHACFAMCPITVTASSRPGYQVVSEENFLQHLREGYILAGTPVTLMVSTENCIWMGKAMVTVPPKETQMPSSLRDTLKIPRLSVASELPRYVRPGTKQQPGFVMLEVEGSSRVPTDRARCAAGSTKRSPATGAQWESGNFHPYSQWEEGVRQIIWNCDKTGRALTTQTRKDTLYSINSQNPNKYGVCPPTTSALARGSAGIRMVVCMSYRLPDLVGGPGKKARLGASL